MGEDDLLTAEQEEKQSDAGLQNQEVEQEEEAGEVDVAVQQNVTNPHTPVAENPSIEDLKQKVENNEGAEKSESKDPNYQEMIRGLEALEQRLRQPVPKAPADQIQAAVELRASCAAICTNANSYIRSHKFSVTKTARSRRRHAQEVSRKCRNDAMNLYVIMKNKTIEEQTTWGQVLDKRAGRILQQAGTDGQIEAQVQAAGMQFPKAESSTDFEKWGLLLAESERGGIGSGNSEYFNRVQEGIRDVSHALQGQFGKFLNDNIKKLTTAGTALQSLLEACISYTARKPRTEKGKVRKNIVEKLKEYAAQDMKGCNNAMDAFFRMSEQEMAAETWETVLRSARSVKISVEDFSTFTAAEGGQASDIVKFETKTGIKYFKKEDSIDLGEARSSSDMARDIAQNETVAKYGEIPEEDKQYIPTLMNKGSKAGEEDYKSVSDKGKPALKFFTRRYVQLFTTIEALLDRMELKDKGGKVNMSRRNVATSRMASLLGLKDLIAESQTVEILDEATGKTIRGNLMNQAEGKEYDDVKNLLKERNITSSFLRELTNLQVLDMLCGQVDRHAHNMMYKVDNGKITGIQGIDNDGAFGLNIDASSVSKGGKDARIFDVNGEEMFIPYMDAHLADRIMQLDGKMLRYALMDLLKEEEINAAIKRLEIMQKGIKNIREKEAFRFLENEEDWTVHKSAEELNAVFSNKEWDKLYEDEKENPELAAKNRGRDMSVEYSFLHRYRENEQMISDAPRVKENRIEVAKEMYGQSDPEGLELLLQYIENPNNLSDEDYTVVNEIKQMDVLVRNKIKRKYKGHINYITNIEIFIE